MPSWSDKDERQYEHIREAQRIAARARNGLKKDGLTAAIRKKE